MFLISYLLCQSFYFCDIILIVDGLGVYFARKISQQVAFVNFTEKEFTSFHLPNRFFLQDQKFNIKI